MNIHCVLFQSAVTSSIYEGVGLPVQDMHTNLRQNCQNPAQTRTRIGGNRRPNFIPNCLDYRVGRSDSRSDGPSYGKISSVLGVDKSDGPTSGSDGPTIV